VWLHFEKKINDVPIQFYPLI